MNTNTLTGLLQQIQRQGTINDADILALRKSIFGDNAVTVSEADTLFAINNINGKPEAWQEFFIDALTDFLVQQTMPHGYINQANAIWLMSHIDHDGLVETHTEIELLLNIMKRAHNVTDELETYALNQVKYAVLNGSGYLGSERSHNPGTIGSADVDMLKRVLYAVSSQSGIGISKLEAEAIFDLNDACANTDNHESWSRLFVGAIANYIMVLAAWEEPSAKEALRRENWLGERHKGIVLPDFMGFGDALKAIFSRSDDLQYSNANSAATQWAERIDAQEASWLIKRLSRDGQLHDNERALLRFLKEESPHIHESLLPYLDVA